MLQVQILSPESSLPLISPLASCFYTTNIFWNRENNFNVQWMEEADGIKAQPSKEDVFIVSHFTGPLFEHLRRFKCTIIGPQCLLVSVARGEPLPEVPSPVFSTFQLTSLLVCIRLNEKDREPLIK